MALAEDFSYLITSTMIVSNYFLGRLSPNDGTLLVSYSSNGGLIYEIYSKNFSTLCTFSNGLSNGF